MLFYILRFYIWLYIIYLTETNGKKEKRQFFRKESARVASASRERPTRFRKRAKIRSDEAEKTWEQMNDLLANNEHVGCRVRVTRCFFLYVVPFGLGLGMHPAWVESITRRNASWQRHLANYSVGNI